MDDSPAPPAVTIVPPTVVEQTLSQYAIASAVGVSRGRVAALIRAGALKYPTSWTHPDQAREWWKTNVAPNPAKKTGASAPATSAPVELPAEVLNPPLEEEDYGSVMVARARVAAKRAYEILATAMADGTRRAAEIGMHLTNHSKAVESHAYARKQHLEYLTAAGALVDLDAAREAVISVVKSLDMLVSKLPTRIACSPEVKAQIEREVLRIRETMAKGPDGVERTLNEVEPNGTETATTKPEASGTDD